MSNLTGDSQTNPTEAATNAKNDNSSVATAANDKIVQLDSEFDQHLSNMKQYILELKDKKCTFKYAHSKYLNHNRLSEFLNLYVYV